MAGQAFMKDLSLRNYQAIGISRTGQTYIGCDDEQMLLWDQVLTLEPDLIKNVQI